MIDEMELDKIGDRKTALFLIMSDTDTTFNFVIAMLQSQLFNLLCDKADDEYGGRLPVHVRVIADEFANIGQIPQFVLLDEATASMDAESETLIQDALSVLLKDKTVMVIAHRMRTVANADKIVVLDNGKVSEMGTPAALMKKGGLYAHLVELQQGK